ncbi:hypothetical protein MAMC_00687 [Methylacidimicrobium cyclopophantes]|uniref:Sodium Bile acid symporter family protein n=1 Tax=Methylacidimicrobium cyclopophantes TaxID=1041766 RepID=A0A5E6M8Q6_9BACT|nr:bile acid:sodium symporter [Methylacidimicrobium cyclopophantes]VVM05576.1 hypothetical protein MAMC_00687 [Methylacidimicrobium cyclopophantes]
MVRRLGSYPTAWLLLLAYLLAAFFPALGRFLREVEFGKIHLFGQSLPLPLSTVPLWIVLFCSGTVVSLEPILHPVTPLTRILAGFFATLLLPLVLLLSFRLLFAPWAKSDQIESLLLGLAIVIAMPIAGFSTIWSERAGGNPALSLKLLFLSTLGSPLFAPWILEGVQGVVSGSYAADLQKVAFHRIGIFLFVCVILPTFLGVLMRQFAQGWILSRSKGIELFEMGSLVLLCYSNATAALPTIVRQKDLRFFLLVLVGTVAFCLFRFWMGHGIGVLLRLPQAGRRSLAFASGMSNNGGGLVLASSVLFDHPRAIFVIVFYDLVQQVLGSVLYPGSRMGATPKDLASNRDTRRESGA